MEVLEERWQHTYTTEILQMVGKKSCSFSELSVLCRSMLYNGCQWCLDVLGVSWEDHPLQRNLFQDLWQRALHDLGVSDAVWCWCLKPNLFYSTIKITNMWWKWEEQLSQIQRVELQIVALISEILPLFYTTVTPFFGRHCTLYPTYRACW